MKYFTADLHFGHGNMLIWDNPFRNKFDNIKEHDDFIIKLWNDTVNQDDEIYVIGDMFFKNIKKARWIIEQLKGRIHLVKGNHEKIALKLQRSTDRFSTIAERIHLKIPEKGANRGFQDIILDHYAGISWNKSPHGSWQLFGHSHGKLNGSYKLSPNQFDVGIDVWERLLSYDDIKEIIKEQNEHENRIEGECPNCGEHLVYGLSEKTFNLFKNSKLFKNGNSI